VVGAKRINFFFQVISKVSLAQRTTFVANQCSLLFLF